MWNPCRCIFIKFGHPNGAQKFRKKAPAASRKFQIKQCGKYSSLAKSAKNNQYRVLAQKTVGDKPFKNDEKQITVKKKQNHGESLT